MFEKINKLSINVFGFENNQISPLYLSKTTVKTINVLFFSDEVIFHYCLRTKFNAFMSRQFEKCTNRKKFCERCLHGFSSQNLHKEYSPLCGEHDAVTIKMPPDGSKLSF